MSNNDSRKFAFGRTVIKECHCPASKAGSDPGFGGETTYVVEMYDEILRCNIDQHCGVVSEETAKEAWEKVVWRLENRDEKETELARSIANELGWDIK